MRVHRQFVQVSNDEDVNKVTTRTTGHKQSQDRDLLTATAPKIKSQKKKYFYSFSGIGDWQKKIMTYHFAVCAIVLCLGVSIEGEKHETGLGNGWRDTDGGP